MVATDDPRSFQRLLAAFLESMSVRGLSDSTRESRRFHLNRFISWCEARGLETLTEVTKPILYRFQRSLFHVRKENGHPLSIRTQHAHLVSVRAFFSWAGRENYILSNPAADIDLPKLPTLIPPHIFSHSEIEEMMSLPDVKTVYGLRDRAILETFYSTGIRRAELAALNQAQLDRERGTLFISQGKGAKDRFVPIGERAVYWIECYLEEARSDLSVAPDEGILFLSRTGKKLNHNDLGTIVKTYMKELGFKGHGSCHLLRHTMATHMLENGADIRYIQALLGHSDLSTTEVYTRVSIRKLKEVHTKTHPARLHPQKPSDEDAMEAQLEEVLTAKLDSAS